MEILLGQKVKCKVTGFVGVAVARTVFLNGCVRVTVQPAAKADGGLPDEKWFDEMQLEAVGKKKIDITQRNTGGPTTSAVPMGLKL